jgi:predicted Rossmann fold nucleotide-binding protein DprA/Smf involved in DNA uptake
MDENKQAIVLLSSHFSTPGKGSPTPLTALEYGRFAGWMVQNGFQPKDLFHRPDELIAKWSDPKGKVTAERVRYLMGRGMAMGLALEKWQGAGLWVVARSEPDYPHQLKTRLGQAAPAVLFGVGEKSLLKAGGLAVIGSRNIGETESRFTRKVSKQAAYEGLNLVSGGARGVDETAMLAALEAEGTALGILANDLFKSALSGKWRKHLSSGNLALVSPFYPEARFQVGNAMGRNKYIYCLADYGLVVRSEQGSGGTWSGATENLQKDWVPLFSAMPSEAEGNTALLEMGAKPLHLEGDNHNNGSSSTWLRNQLTAVPFPPSSHEFIESNSAKASENVVNESMVDADAEMQKNGTGKSRPRDPGHITIESYSEFLSVVSQFLADRGETKIDVINDHFKGLPRKRVRAWLDAAVEAGELSRPGRPLIFDVNRQSDSAAWAAQ